MLCAVMTSFSFISLRVFAPRVLIIPVSTALSGIILTAVPLSKVQTLKTALSVGAVSLETAPSSAQTRWLAAVRAFIPFSGSAACELLPLTVILNISDAA